MNTGKFNKQDNVYIPEGIATDAVFEQLYLKVRDQEQRMYTDNQLMQLPEIDVHHPHHKEWQVRKKSSGRFINYVRKKSRGLQILEIGCGNGWLSNKLAAIPGIDVVALDINLTELKQGAIVFRKENLQFVYGDIRQGVLEKEQFDIIIFAASLPYFSPLNEIIHCALNHLAESGEIHITDNFFYNNEALAAARQNCKTYYKRMGIQEMADHYFHYSLGDLSGFNFDVLNRTSFFNKLFFKKDIFPWICIRHSKRIGNAI